MSMNEDDVAVRVPSKSDGHDDFVGVAYTSLDADHQATPSAPSGGGEGNNAKIGGDKEEGWVRLKIRASYLKELQECKGGEEEEEDDEDEDEEEGGHRRRGCACDQLCLLKGFVIALISTLTIVTCLLCVSWFGPGTGNYEVVSCKLPMEIDRHSVGYMEANATGKRGGQLFDRPKGGRSMTLCPKKSGLYAFSMVANGLGVRDYMDYLEQAGNVRNRFEVVGGIVGTDGGIVASGCMDTDSIKVYWPARPRLSLTTAYTLSATGKIHAFLEAGLNKEGDGRLCYTPTLWTEHSFMTMADDAKDACREETFYIEEHATISLQLSVKLVE